MGKASFFNFQDQSGRLQGYVRVEDLSEADRKFFDLVDIGDIVAEPLALIAQPAALPPRERLAIEYTRAAMTDSNAVPDALMVEMADHFSDPELVELSFLIGYINMLNLFNNLLHARYHGEYSLLRTPVAASSEAG